MKILLVVGLPGSGKTYWAERNSDVVVDDITDTAQLPATIANGQTLAVTSPLFCDENVLANAIEYVTSKYGVAPLAVYFENDPIKCKKNVLQRADAKKKVDGFIEMYTKIYSPPNDAMKIWEIENV